MATFGFDYLKVSSEWLGVNIKLPKVDQLVFQKTGLLCEAIKDSYDCR
jgi:hypothetical protein